MKHALLFEMVNVTFVGCREVDLRVYMSRPAWQFCRSFDRDNPADPDDIGLTEYCSFCAEVEPNCGSLPRRFECFGFLFCVQRLPTESGQVCLLVTIAREHLGLRGGEAENGSTK